jgi:nitrile hydratase
VNGIHDLGGMHGFGAVAVEDGEAFHADWERSAFALMLLSALQGLIGEDLRPRIEGLGNGEYLRQSYFERWLTILEPALVERGVLEPGELAARIAECQARAWHVPDPGEPAPSLAAALELLRGGSTPGPRPEAHPRFAAGDAVRTRDINPVGHTRLPRYARGRQGTVDRYLGPARFPDEPGSPPQPVYSVRFEADELWGEDADGRGAVYIDIWEGYLE